MLAQTQTPSTRYPREQGTELTFFSHISYVAFTSINSSDPSHPVTAFSPIFSSVCFFMIFLLIYLLTHRRLDGMSGSFDSPVPELTSTTPVPSSLLSAHSNQIFTSTLPGTVSLSTTRTPSSSSLPSSSPRNSSPSSSSTSSTSPTSSRPNAAMRHSVPPVTITLIGLSVSLLV